MKKVRAGSISSPRRDPVRGVKIKAGNAYASRRYEGRGVHFRSGGWVRRLDEVPEKFTTTGYVLEHARRVKDAVRLPSSSATMGRLRICAPDRCTSLGRMKKRERVPQA